LSAHDGLWNLPERQRRGARTRTSARPGRPRVGVHGGATATAMPLDPAPPTPIDARAEVLHAERLPPRAASITACTRPTPYVKPTPGPQTRLSHHCV